MSNPDVGFIHTEKDFAYIIILLFDSLKKLAVSDSYSCRIYRESIISSTKYYYVNEEILLSPIIPWNE